MVCFGCLLKTIRGTHLKQDVICPWHNCQTYLTFLFLYFMVLCEGCLYLHCKITSSVWLESSPVLSEEALEEESRDLLPLRPSSNGSKATSPSTTSCFIPGHGHCHCTKPPPAAASTKHHQLGLRRLVARGRPGPPGLAQHQGLNLSEARQNIHSWSGPAWSQSLSAFRFCCPIYFEDWCFAKLTLVRTIKRSNYPSRNWRYLITK